MIFATTIAGKRMFFEGNIGLAIMAEDASTPIEKSVAIVGTRNPTELGVRIAHSIAAYFASHGFTIVSGLAKGIDTAAHKGALSVGGCTIAVLGTDLGHIYPKENAGLAQAIIDNNGLLITEYDNPEYDRAKAKARFTARDHIQVALSQAVIPVQAGIPSGTLTTTRSAWKQNCPIFVPIPQTADLEKYPDRYAGIMGIIKSGKCTTFAGKQDYPDLLKILNSAHKRNQLTEAIRSQIYATNETAPYIQQRWNEGCLEEIEDPNCSLERLEQLAHDRGIELSIEVVLK